MQRNEGNFITKYSQNEIINTKLVQRLVKQSSITEVDLVYDIGAGSGAISKALLDKGARVIAFENDRRQFNRCQRRFSGQDRFEVHLMDFLIWEFPKGHQYKVFANIPFFRTADIINKLLLDNDDPPQDCYLIVQKEAAEKYGGIPRDTLISLLIKPIFWLDIIHRFQKTDFHPVPSVDVVLLQVAKRDCRLVPEKYYGLYKNLIIFCREGPHRTIKQALKRLFPYYQLKRLADSLSINYRSNPADLDFHQYLGIFQFYLEHQPRNTALSRGAEEELRKKQSNIVKSHRTVKRRPQNSS